ncbi:TetR/AcrR family transcriptional regulator [Streptomyces angustmyceticus]|uniref:TetR/AcrR family transcriptional regulator n=1 Tax=Streptomyces angustmyceticus TaxID=285578 RepID=UPI0021AFF2BC|nr:TetR/AcrR family transcriptional regulator [Streptomyces angustmyceticus]
MTRAAGSGAVADAVAAGEWPGPAAPGRRGRPRSAAAGPAVIEAVLRLVEGGACPGELSMERIAREAGVGKATVYRRWPGRTALMRDVLRSLDVPGPPLDGTSVRDDLVALLEFLRRGPAGRGSALLRTLAGHAGARPELWAEYHDTLVRARHEALLTVLRRGVANGEIRTDRDLETIADLFTGPVLARALLQERTEPPGSRSADLVDLVLEGVRPVAGAAAGRTPARRGGLGGGP